MSNKWTSDKIKKGFDRFFQEHGRLPLAKEIDELDYLPSSRWIQKKFDGLENLRAVLGYTDTNFGKGKYRSVISNRVGKKGREIELWLEKILQDKFHEVFVHTEKIFDDSKNRVDFFVYSPDGNFGVDIFYTDTMSNLQNNINIKIDKYKKFPNLLFLVVGNSKFKQEELDEYSQNKKKILPKNTSIITTDTLLKIIENKQSYLNPLLPNRN